MGKSLTSSRCQRNDYGSSKISVAPIERKVSSTLFVDKTLEEEFLSILKPCDISPRNIDCTEKSLISNNIDKTLEEEFLSILKLCGISPRSFDGESCHNSIIDSALRSNNIRASDMHTTVVIPTTLTSTMCPSSARCPRIEFPISKLMDDPTTCSPLLNPNAIHERRSLDILKIKEDCCNDDGVPENEKQELDVGDCYYATTTNLSSNTHSFRKKIYRCALPMVRVLSPPFARHQRTEEKNKGYEGPFFNYCSTTNESFL